MKKMIVGTILAASAVAASAGVASASDINGDTAPHSTAPVTSLLNGDAEVGKNVKVPAQAAVPVIASKVGPYQGANENSAPQEDGDLLPISNG